MSLIVFGCSEPERAMGPLAVVMVGVHAEEAFEVRPYALATYAYLVRNPFCQQMARKFKIAFSACPEDCAATAIHDIGALGRVRE